MEKSDNIKTITLRIFQEKIQYTVLKPEPRDVTVYDNNDSQQRLYDEYYEAFSYYIKELTDEWSYSPAIFEGKKAKKKIEKLKLNNDSVILALWEFEKEIFIISFDGFYVGYNTFMKLVPSINAILIIKK